MVNEWLAPAFGIIGAVVGAIVGSAITYFIQTNTERNAWKKEIAEKVYYSLYSNVKAIKTSLEKGKFERVSFSTWSEFQNDYRYLQVQPVKFREQLDKFLKKLDGNDRDVIRLINEVFPEIVQKASEKIFRIASEQINIIVKCKQPSGRFEQGNFTPVLCLRENKHPRDLLLEIFPESEIVSFSVNIGPSIVVGLPPKEIDEAKFNEFWKLCLEIEGKNEICKRVVQKHGELLKESESIFKELKKRIVDIIP